MTELTEPWKDLKGQAKWQKADNTPVSPKEKREKKRIIHNLTTCGQEKKGAEIKNDQRIEHWGEMCMVIVDRQREKESEREREREKASQA